MRIPRGAVVLTGGTAVRLGGADKASIELGGRTLLERALSVLDDHDEVVVVGDEMPTGRPVTFTREHPPYGGPAAGLLAGVDALVGAPRWVVVLAVDMPFVTPATLNRLLAAADGHDGAMLADGGGRPQLTGVLDHAALLAARPPYVEDGHGLPLHRLLAPLDLVAVPARGDEARDIDTWADLSGLTGPDPGR